MFVCCLFICLFTTICITTVLLQINLWLPWFNYSNHVFWGVFLVVKPWLISVRICGPCLYVFAAHFCIWLCCEYLPRFCFCGTFFVFGCVASICSAFSYLVVLYLLRVSVIAACFCIWLCCEYLQCVSLFGCVASICSTVLSNWWRCFLNLMVLFYLLVFSICFLGHRTAGLLIITLYRRGVDKNLVCLLRDWTEGNTMVKVWRQIQENHFEEYLHRKDLYTTLLMTITKPGGIVSALGHTFEAPPPPRELPSARLLRHASLLAEANNVQDYRNQILSTFGTVLKMGSTKKVCNMKIFRGKKKSDQ